MSCPIRVGILMGILIRLLKCDSNIFTSSNSNSNYLSNTELYNVTKYNHFECNNSLDDCSHSGICDMEKLECTCFEAYKTVFKNPEDYFSNKPRCNYKMKRQIYAVILALFVSFGFLQFYLGNVILGLTQMVIFGLVTGINIYLITKVSIKHLKNQSQGEFRNTLSLSVMICFFSLICFFWYLFDVFMVLFNIYKDENNVELYSFTRRRDKTVTLPD